MKQKEVQKSSGVLSNYSIWNFRAKHGNFSFRVRGESVQECHKLGDSLVTLWVEWVVHGNLEQTTNRFDSATQWCKGK